MGDIIELVIEVLLRCTHFEKLPRLIRQIVLTIVFLISMTSVMLFIYFGLTMKNNLVLILFLFFAFLIIYFTRKLIIDTLILTKYKK